MTDAGQEPLPPAPAFAAALLFVVVAVLAAVVEVLLVPVRIGTAVVPVTVALGIATTVGVPILGGRATGRTLGAALPLIAWIVTVIALSQARPEGDVLLVGTAPLVYVTYALLVLGAVAGIATVLAVDRRRLTAGRPAAVVPVPAPQPKPLRPAAESGPPTGRPAPPRTESTTGPATGPRSRAQKRRR